MRIPEKPRSSSQSVSVDTGPLTPVNKSKLATLKAKIPILQPAAVRPSMQATPPSNRAIALTGALAQGILRQKGMLQVRDSVAEAARSSIRGQRAGTSRSLRDRAGAPAGTTFQPGHT